MTDANETGPRPVGRGHHADRGDGGPHRHPQARDHAAGLVLADFVDRVGDPVGIVAPDGSVHRGETLLADALRALAYAATAGRPLPAATAVTHPAHWRPGAVEALRRALRRIPEWTADEPLLIADTAAAADRAAGRSRPAHPRGDRAVRLRRQRNLDHPARRRRRLPADRADRAASGLLR